MITKKEKNDIVFKRPDQSPIKVSCPDCEDVFAIPVDSEVGEIIECENCGAEMEILSVKPVQVSLIEEEK